MAGPPLTPLEVIVIAAFPATRAGLRALVDGVEGVHVVDERPLTRAGEDGHPAAVLLADAGEDPGGAVRELSSRFPGRPAVVVGDWSDGYPRWPPGTGFAFVGREAGGDELAAAIRAVARGLVVFEAGPAVGLLAAGPARGAPDAADPQLTDREREVLALMAEGLPNKAIALRLGMSEHTAKFHVGSILAKLDAASRTEAVTAAARRGLLTL